MSATRIFTLALVVLVVMFLVYRVSFLKNLVVGA